MKESDWFRRQGVCLPWSTAEAIGIDQAHVEVPTDGSLAWLWSMGFFRELSEECGVLIDEHEEEDLPIEQIPRAVQVISKWRRPMPPGQLLDFMQGLQGLCERARELDVPIRFVL